MPFRRSGFTPPIGKYGDDSEERGVFKSTDGGDTWRRVLYRDTKTGAVDLALDRNDPDVVYAALWQAFRKEYTMASGGPGSGLFKSTDGGESWTEITRNPGLPQEGLVGRIGLALTSANSSRVYALVENDEGGLFRSDDGGATWENVLFVADSVGAVDIVMNPRNPRELYAGMWRAERKPWTLRGHQQRDPRGLPRLLDRSQRSSPPGGGQRRGRGRQLRYR